MPHKFYIYEIKTDLFDNGDMEEFLFLVQNFNMTLEASGTIAAKKTFHCLCNLLGG